MQYPIGPVPLLLVLSGLWMIKSAYKERAQPIGLGMLLLISFWSVIFALLLFLFPPHLVMTVVSQAATVALTYGTIYYLRSRVVAAHRRPLIVETIGTWRSRIFVGISVVVVINYLSSQAAGKTCQNSRCDLYMSIIGDDPRFSVLLISTVLGALGLSSIISGLEHASRRFR